MAVEVPINFFASQRVPSPVVGLLSSGVKVTSINLVHVCIHAYIHMYRCTYMHACVCIVRHFMSMYVLCMTAQSQSGTIEQNFFFTNAATIRHVLKVLLEKLEV
jgi:hypothetical protein